MEMAPKVKLYSNGRITVPKAVRKYLKLRPGSRVEIVIQQDGTVALRRMQKKLSRPSSPASKIAHARKLSKKRRRARLQNRSKQ